MENNLNFKSHYNCYFSSCYLFQKPFLLSKAIMNRKIEKKQVLISFSEHYNTILAASFIYLSFILQKIQKRFRKKKKLPGMNIKPTNLYFSNWIRNFFVVIFGNSVCFLIFINHDLPFQMKNSLQYSCVRLEIGLFLTADLISLVASAYIHQLTICKQNSHTLLMRA